MSQEQLKKLEETFKNADNDKNGLLNSSEFKEFITLAYNKPCPDGMYEYICNHYEKDLNSGIDWSIARDVWLQANNNNNNNDDNHNNNNNLSSIATSELTVQSSIHSSHLHLDDNNNHITPSNLHTQKSHSNVASNQPNPKGMHHFGTSFSNLNSIGLTQEALKKHENIKSIGNLKELIDIDQLSENSDHSATRHHGTASPTKNFMRRHTNNNSMDLAATDDATSMIVQIMETKLKTAQQQLKDEKIKKKNGTIIRGIIDIK